MEHLAARGLTCPQPVKNRTGDMLGWIAGRPAAIVTVPRRHVDPPPERRPLRGGRRGAGAAASCRRGFSDAAGATRSRSTAGGRSMWRRPRAPTACSRDLRETIERELTLLEGAWPSRTAGRRDPCRPVSRQRVLPRRPAVRPDRFLLRLHRHARLRRRDLPQRVVLRAGSLLQRHQGARAAAGLRRGAAALGRGARRAAAARARRRAALPADAPRRLAQRAARRAGAPEGPARIFPQAALPPGGRRACATTGSTHERGGPAHNVVIYTDGGCAPTNPGPGRLGRDPASRASTEGAEGRRAAHRPTIAWN